MESKKKKNLNEAKYEMLIARYKETRGKLGPTANLYLYAAMKLREGGNVSEDVVKGMALL
jgi:hypothetical protein